MFIKYQHIERLGRAEVDGILNGWVTVMPKIDGSNGCIWFEDGEIHAGSRNREISLEDDNQGFAIWVAEKELNLRDYFGRFPHNILYGEWLVPHSLKAYKQTCWKEFYVFDVFDRVKDVFLPYDTYVWDLDESQIVSLPSLETSDNMTEERLMELMASNTYLLDPALVEAGVRGEGLVIKNYAYQNRYGRTVWAKLISEEFAVGRSQARVPKKIFAEGCEGEIVEQFLTEAFLLKELAKLLDGREWERKMTSELIGRVWHEFITEEMFAILKKFKNPTINFKNLNKCVIEKMKSLLPNCF